MSELIDAHANVRDFRRRLLTTVAAAALLASVCSMHQAKAADDTDHPAVWIELGGQLERNDGAQEPFAPPFTLISPTPTPYSPVSPAEAQKPSTYSYGADGKISFEPADTGWVFSAAVRYGRSNNNKHVHQQSMAKTPNPKYGVVIGTYVIRTRYISYPKFADFIVKNRESHAIVDFKAGKDVGLGLFGREGSAQLDFGVRVAQFSSKSTVNMIARPEVQFPLYEFAGKYMPFPVHHDFVANANNDRSFHGVGPSISFDASTALFGNPNAGSVRIDWGFNAAILFGRQKARGNQATTERYYNRFSPTTGTQGLPPVYQHHASHNRSRTVTVPNVGGFAGVSFHYPNAKVSLGYRADFFFGAIDGGINAAKKENRGFYGPFANISVGIGG